jgi:4'-phosphopantetheinyl transferase
MMQPGASRRQVAGGAEQATVAPPLEDAACQVWWARPADARPPLDLLLDQAERDRRGRLLRQDDRDRLTVGAALARLVLAAHLGRPAERVRFDRACRRCGAQHGKPRLLDDSTGLQFSVAHSGQRVAVAVVRGALIGVDVEHLAASARLEVDALAREVLSEDEQAAFRTLAARDRLPGLLTYWTRKEALLKATGDGLSVPMATITVSGPDEPPRLQRWPALSSSHAPVAIEQLHPGAGYVASLAVLGLPAVRVSEFDAEEPLACWNQADQNQADQ